MEEILKTVKEIQSKFLGVRDAPDDPLCRQLEKQIQQIRDDVERKRDHRAIEDRVKEAIRTLDEIDDADHIMDYNHANDLKHRFEHLRNDLRSM